MARTKNVRRHEIIGRYETFITPQRIVAAVELLGGRASLSQIYAVMKMAANQAGYDLPAAWMESIRARIQECSSDCREYNNDLDIFGSSFGFGAGIWELRQKRPKQYSTVKRNTSTRPWPRHDEEVVF